MSGWLGLKNYVYPHPMGINSQPVSQISKQAYLNSTRQKCDFLLSILEGLRGICNSDTPITHYHLKGVIERGKCL